MASRRRTKEEDQPRRKPATTPEARENTLVSLSMDLAETQMRDGSASSQVITHFIKLGSSRERLEQQRIAHENELLEVKKEAIASQKRVEELYISALDAMRSYSGNEKPEQDEYDED